MKIPPLTDPLARDLAIGLKVHTTPGDSKRLGLDSRLTRDEDVRHLALKLAEHLRRSGWKMEHR